MQDKVSAKSLPVAFIIDIIAFMAVMSDRTKRNGRQYGPLHQEALAILGESSTRSPPSSLLMGLFAQLPVRAEGRSRLKDFESKLMVWNDIIQGGKTTYGESVDVWLEPLKQLFAKDVAATEPTTTVIGSPGSFADVVVMLFRKELCHVDQSETQKRLAWYFNTPQGVEMVVVLMEQSLHQYAVFRARPLQRLDRFIWLCELVLELNHRMKFAVQPESELEQRICEVFARLL